MEKINRGLDLSDLNSITDEEVQGFRDFYRDAIGVVHRGLDFWLRAGRPDVLKRYREHADTQQPGGLESRRQFRGFVFLPFYALVGYDAGVRYLVHLYQWMGLTRSQVLEGLALAFLHGGPRGMETIAIALDDYQWIEPRQPATFHEGWAPDPDAFRSGLDFSSRNVGAGEMDRLRSWYRDTLGEIPPYVDFMSRHRPQVLKAYRNRYENIFVELPKQTMPFSLLHYNVIRLSEDGIRENVLLARAFGITKRLTLESIASAMNNGGPEAMSVVSRAAGDILAEEWPNG